MARGKKHKYKKTNGWMRKELVVNGVLPEQVPRQDAKMQRMLEDLGYVFGEEKSDCDLNR